MDIILNFIEVRVLGALVEKENTTPEYYPLSLNALVNACNQKSNRDPVMSLDEESVRQALDSLTAKGLAGVSRSAEGRVAKFEHRLQESFNFNRREAAVLCVLLLRGPQTPGELRGRTERMHRFEDLGEIQTTLQWLMKREPPLVKMLPRHSGTKEARYAHLLAGEVEGWEPAPDSDATSDSPTADRIARLEDQVSFLQKEVDDLKQTLAEFRKQFE